VHGQSSKRIKGTALEVIMQDVLQGMTEFTSETCCGSEAAAMEIIAVEEAESNCLNSAQILPFNRNSRR